MADQCNTNKNEKDDAPKEEIVEESQPKEGENDGKTSGMCPRDPPISINAKLDAAAKRKAEIDAAKKKKFSDKCQYDDAANAKDKLKGNIGEDKDSKKFDPCAPYRKKSNDTCKSDNDKKQGAEQKEGGKKKKWSVCDKNDDKDKEKGGADTCEKKEKKVVADTCAKKEEKKENKCEKKVAAAETCEKLIIKSSQAEKDDLKKSRQEKKDDFKKSKHERKS